jgi:hypothetical protein
MHYRPPPSPSHIHSSAPCAHCLPLPRACQRPPSSLPVDVASQMHGVGDASPPFGHPHTRRSIDLGSLAHRGPMGAPMEPGMGSGIPLQPHSAAAAMQVRARAGGAGGEGAGAEAVGTAWAGKFWGPNLHVYALSLPSWFSLPQIHAVANLRSSVGSVGMVLPQYAPRPPGSPMYAPTPSLDTPDLSSMLSQQAQRGVAPSQHAQQVLRTVREHEGEVGGEGGTLSSRSSSSEGRNNTGYDQQCEDGAMGASRTGTPPIDSNNGAFFLKNESFDK